MNPEVDVAIPSADAAEPTIALSPGRPLAATQSGHHVFRFGMRAFLIGSVLFSLQFLAWNLLGVLIGSLVNLFLILLDPEEHRRITLLRRALSELSPVDSMETLVGKLSKSKTNAEFLMGMNVRT